MNTGAREQLTGMQVLVVEDVATAREVIRMMLEAHGATVVEASTAREALELAEAQEFDVVLTDLGLPDASGGEIVAGIRSASDRKTPVAVVSGADARTLARAIEGGAERVFKKPVDRDSLIRYLAGKRKVGVEGTYETGVRQPT